jgi:hypothetical protein
MDFLNKYTGGESKDNKATTGSEKPQQESGIMDKLHGMVGGGKESEKNEDGLDKGMSFDTLSYVLVSTASPASGQTLTVMIF